MLTRIVRAAVLAALLPVVALWAGAADAQGAKRHHPAAPPPSPPSSSSGAAGTHRVEIVNHETARIVSVFISSPEDDDWGDDLLGDDELDTQAAATLRFKGPCRADIRIDFDGGASESRRRVDVCRFPSLVIEPGWTLKPLVAA